MPCHRSRTDATFGVLGNPRQRTRQRFYLDAMKLHQKGGLGTLVHKDQTGTLEYANLAIVGT